MKCKVEKRADGARILIRGAVKRDLSLSLSDALEKLVDRKTPNIILDLSQVDFLDSSCLGLIIFTSKRMKAYGGTLSIQHPAAAIQELLAESRLSRVVQILEEES